MEIQAVLLEMLTKDVVDLSRFSSGYLIAILAIKETRHGIKTRNGISAGSSSTGADEWAYPKTDCCRSSLSLHHPDGRAFAAGAMGGMHTGDKLSNIGETHIDKAIDDFLDGLGEYYDGTALNFPHVSNVISARV